MTPARLHVATTGTGPALVLTHGLGDTSATWDAVVPALAEHHEVTRWDLRGHGRSATPAGPAAYSRDLAVADLLRVVDGATPPVTLVGHSLGGYLSLIVALRHPDLVGRLVMVSSGPGFRRDDGRESWNRYVDRVARAMPIPPEAGRLCHQPDAWAIERLPSLRCPLVQVVGGEDHRFHDGVAYVQRVLPESVAATVDGAGHHPQNTHPDEVVAAIDGPRAPVA